MTLSQLMLFCFLLSSKFELTYGLDQETGLFGWLSLGDGQLKFQSHICGLGIVLGLGAQVIALKYMEGEDTPSIWVFEVFVATFFGFAIALNETAWYTTIIDVFIVSLGSFIVLHLGSIGYEELNSQTIIPETTTPESEEPEK